MRDGRAVDGDQDHREWDGDLQLVRGTRSQLLGEQVGMRVGWKRVLLYVLVAYVLLNVIGYAVFGFYGGTEVGLR